MTFPVEEQPEAAVEALKCWLLMDFQICWPILIFYTFCLCSSRTEVFLLFLYWQSTGDMMVKKFGI